MNSDFKENRKEDSINLSYSNKKNMKNNEIVKI